MRSVKFVKALIIAILMTGCAGVILEYNTRNASQNCIIFGKAGLRIMQASDDITDVYWDYHLQDDRGNEQHGIKTTIDSVV